LAEVERERRVAGERARQLEAEAALIASEAEALNARLEEAARRRELTDQAAIDAALRLSDLSERAHRDSAEAARSRRALETSLAAHLFAARRMDPAASRQSLILRAAGPVVLAQASAGARALRETQRLSTETALESQILAEAKTALEDERTGLSVLAAERQGARAALTAEAQAAERRATQLASEARNLRQLADRAAARAHTRTASIGASGGGAAPARWLAPAPGQVVRAYGEREASDRTAQGSTLRTPSGAQVSAPSDGEVAYADVFRGYGRVLILNLDGGYAVVLAGLESMNVRVGERVRAGQAIGAMPISVTPAPELYVEVRRQGRPVSPAQWLNARGLTADRGVRNAG
jgi:septal ring factor EnvC (AmiA/AmiB activator)